MKAILISRLQVTLVITFTVIVGMSGPFVRRCITSWLQDSSEMATVPVNPNALAGFELVEVITFCGFLLAWACFVAANRWRAQASEKWWLLSMPVMLGLLGWVAAEKLRPHRVGHSSLEALPDGTPPAHEFGSAAIIAIETFWLSAAVLAVLLLSYFVLVPVSADRAKPA